MHITDMRIFLQLKWTARSLKEGRNIARKLAAENNTMTLNEMPDLVNLSSDGILTFSWHEDRHAPVIIRTYEGQRVN